MSIDKKKWEGFIPYFIFLIVILITLLPQISSRSTIIGADTFFHFGRFYDTAMQFKTGIFSYFQTDFGFQQSGRVINAAYGPVFAYLNGLLVLLAGSWFKYQIISDFLISFIGALSMYQLCKYLKINSIIGTFISLIYMNIGMIPNYINGSAFNGWGQAFMPWVLLCGIKMITDKKEPINWIQLMLIISILGQIHLLSTLFATALLVPFFVIAIIQSHDKLMWINLIKAIIGSIVLTANVWGGLLVLKQKNYLSSPSPFDLRLSQVSLLGYFQGRNYYWGSVNGNILPILLFLVIIEIIFVAFNFKKNIVITTCTILGALGLFVTSIYFPWGALQTRFLFLQRLLQFPYRLLVIVYPLVLISGALIIQRYFQLGKLQKIILIIFLGALSAEAIVPSILNNRYFTENFTRNATIQKEARSSNLYKLIVNNTYGRMPDYLPMQKKTTNNSKLGLMYRAKVEKTYKKYKHSVLKDGTLILKWNRKNKIEEVPVIKYQQSIVKINGKQFKGKTNLIGMPIVKTRKGINELSIKFKIPFWFNILNVGCLLVWIITIYIIEKNYLGKKLRSVN